MRARARLACRSKKKKYLPESVLNVPKSGLELEYYCTYFKSKKKKPRANAKSTNHGGRNSEIGPYDAAADNAAHGTALHIRPRLTLSVVGEGGHDVCVRSRRHSSVENWRLSHFLAIQRRN